MCLLCTSVMYVCYSVGYNFCWYSRLTALVECPAAVFLIISIYPALGFLWLMEIVHSDNYNCRLFLKVIFSEGQDWIGQEAQCGLC